MNTGDRIVVIWGKIDDVFMIAGFGELQPLSTRPDTPKLVLPDFLKKLLPSERELTKQRYVILDSGDEISEHLALFRPESECPEPFTVVPPSVYWGEELRAYGP